MAIYDAFISYSHAKDKPIAAALQSVIQKLGKPWYQRRALLVFRDDTSLSATPHLWPSIEQALGASRFLILLASPEAAASKWVGREVEYWLANKGADTLLIAITDSTLVWDEGTADFRWSDTTPLPPALKGRFQHEPKWVDFTQYRERRNPRDSRFIELAADFAAAVRGIPKEDLLSQELRQQRRALTLAWSAAAALLVLVAAATWQWTEAVAQRRQAQAQRDRAQSTLDAGIGSANDFTLKVAASMRQTVGIPADLVRDILGRAQKFQDQLIKYNETDPKLQRSRAMLLREMSQTLLFQRDRDEALALAVRARAIMDGLPKADADDFDVQQERSHTHNRIGEALSQLGRRPEALQSFREALAIRIELAARRPGTEQQLAVAFSHERIGDELFPLQRREEALRAHQASFTIRQAIVQEEPDNQEAQGMLAVSYDRIGLTLGNAGQEAFEAYSKSLAIREKLVQADPRNSRWQRDLATSLDYIGSLILKAGKSAEAMVHFRRALAVRDRLASGDPKNPVWKELLVISYVNLAEAGDNPAENYRKALAIIIELESSDRLGEQKRGWRVEIERRLSDLRP